MTEATKLAAGQMAFTRLRGLGARRFKNIPLPVRLYAASGVPDVALLAAAG